MKNIDVRLKTNNLLWTTIISIYSINNKNKQGRIVKSYIYNNYILHLQNDDQNLTSRSVDIRYEPYLIFFFS